MDITVKLKELLVSMKGKDDDITSHRRHDTIFIDGERGTGKTAFLVNIKKWIEESDKEASNDEKLSSGLAFFGPVDPTLLLDDENFLGVVLGTIVEQVEKEIDENCKDADGDRQPYYKALEAVSESLRAVFDLRKGEVSGIDAIASHASSKMLEQKAHSFFGAVANLLGKKALVLLIDDVDMAFDKGFDVLETIRRFLASPYIIPIVSGDAKLYKHLVKKEFKIASEYKRDVFCGKTVKMDEKDLQYMVDQYFNKVMPNDQRIELLSIRRLRKKYPMLIKASNDKEIYYNQFKDFDIQLINYGINQVQFTSQVFPDNLRSFVQYLAKKREVIAAIDSKTIQTAEIVHTPYQPGKAKEMVDGLYNNNFNLFLKSISATASFYHYSKVLEEKRLSLMLENDLNAVQNGQISTYAIYKGHFFQDDAYRKEQEEYDSRIDDKRVFCEIKKEYLDIRIYFEKETLSKYLSSDDSSDKRMQKVVTRLFFYDSYYNESSATRAYIVAGKFIEALLYSFELKGDNLDKAIEKFNEIANGRAYNIGIEKNYINDDVEESEEGQGYPDQLFESSVVEKIYEWHKQYVTIGEESNNRYDLSTNRLHLVLHKFFNNLNALKKSKDIKTILSNDDPCSFMARICAILLNAVAFFEKEGSVEESNIAMVKGKFDYVRLRNNSNTFKKNIEPMLEKEESLTFVLSEHPFIKTTLTKTGECEVRFEYNTSNILEQRKKLLNKHNIKGKTMTDHNVAAYLNDVENTHNQDLIRLIIDYFEKKGVLEYMMLHEKKFASAQEFYKNNKQE